MLHVEPAGPTSIDALWRLPVAEIAVSDAELAIEEVAARHAGVIFRRYAPDENATETREWVKGVESFLIGLPQEYVEEHGDAPALAPDEDGLYWGELWFSSGERGDDETGDVGASVRAPPMHEGDGPFQSILDFAGQVAAELGGVPEFDELERLQTAPPSSQAPAQLTWAQIRSWLRQQSLQITEEQRDWVSFVLCWDEDLRAQLVTIDRVERFQAPWLRISSGVCKVHQLSAGEALLYNDRLVASLARDEVDYYLVHHVPMAGLTLEMLDQLIWDVGSEADTLEQELTEGLDEY